MSEIGKLYPDVLLDHHRSPRRAGRLALPTHAADGNNPLCGDRVGVTLAVGEGRVLDIRCEVKGCAICRAAGSMMAETVAGLELGEVNALVRRFLLAINEPSPTAEGAGGADQAQPGSSSGDATSEAAALSTAADAEWGQLAVLLEARRFPSRRRCAGLSWEVLARALSSPNGS